MRGVGVTEWLAGLVPESLVPVLLALTFLGDPVFLVAAAALTYWLGPRLHAIERANAARLLALTLGAMALTVLLKEGFALARPPAAVMLVAESGHGFPSGHATGSAAVYGGLAMLAHWRTRTTRWILGGSLVVLVALTRLLLGVHYLVDVLVGATVGLLFAALVVRVTRRGIRHGFRLAAVVALATPLVVGVTVDVAMVVGGALGALVVWEAWGEKLRESGHGVSLPLAVVGFVVLGGLAGGVYALEPSPPLAMVANAVTGAGFVALPLLQKVSR